MKVIFLDIDGVLNSVDYMNALHHHYRSLVYKGEAEYPIPDDHVKDSYGQYFDPRCVLYLESIINFTDCKIVISSTWRKQGLDKMKNLWKWRDLPGEIVGITPILNKSRGEEIEAYLLEHDYITNYCIIDDHNDMLFEQSDKFIQVDGRYGLVLWDTKQIIKILCK